MRRLYKFSVLILIVILSFSGCTVSKKENNNEVVVWCHLTNNEIIEINNIAQQWGKERGIKVKVYSDKGDNRAFIEASKNNMAPDIEFGIPHDRMQKLNSEKLLAEVPEGVVDKSKYLTSALETVSFGNKLYGAPLSIETYALYYNKDKISTPPGTLEELIEEGKKFGFQYDINNFYLSFPFLQVNGAYIFGKNNNNYEVTNIGLNNEGARKGYGIIQDMVQKYKLMPANIDNIAARNNFKSGKTALYFSGSWDLEEVSKANINYAVAPLPKYQGRQMTTFVTSQVAFVTPKAKNKKEAWDLFKYLLEKSPEVLFKTTGRIPALNIENSIPQVKNNDKEKMFVKQAEYGELIPNVTEIQAVQGANKVMTQLTAGKISPEECGNKIEGQIREFIKKEKQ